MGVRNYANQTLDIVLVLSHFLRVPEIHNYLVRSRHLRHLLLSHASFRFHFSVCSHLFELDDRCQAFLRQHRSWSDDHCQSECLDRLRNPVLANAPTIQAAETDEAKA